VGFDPTIPAFERGKTVSALSRVSIARSCSFAENSFVCLCVNNRVHVQHRSAAAACGCDRRCSSTTRPSQLKEHSTLKSLCRGANNRSTLPRHAPSSRAAVFDLPPAATWYRLREANQRIWPRAAAALNPCPALERMATLIGLVTTIMWEPRRLTNLWAFTACYRDSFTFFMYE
jgi:hypothetical protein